MTPCNELLLPACAYCGQRIDNDPVAVSETFMRPLLRHERRQRSEALGRSVEVEATALTRYTHRGPCTRFWNRKPRERWAGAR